ncbi:GNAT family N-acetyltransferase [Nocardia cyriacigeorgica]|uniref:GNAT family N-acetyltransferase n=1 Tax=Nocardia cyriacigeorgica TaxID=135487 RepID=UPI001894A52C|nr:GNAT family N-acetyltransferase [Nocardia cyriacigeorgica]MBF6398445.1 GNAT family N-acetyltransferase [Nocardia cyriacigeorgica]MBF6404041.1 GNAT family N-acetyltransferase [Nocardia cyriacigeorgica]
MIVRRVPADEWETARAIRLDALAGSPPGTFSTTFAEASTWDEQRWRAWAAPRTLFVAENDTVPLGSAAGWRADGQAELVSMWVHPVARGSGVSDRLVQAVIDWARNGGHPTLGLWVLAGNHHAEHLYRRNGFRRTGRSQPCSPGDPRLENEMVLRLSP